MKHKEIFSLVLFSLIITAFPHPGLSLPNPGKPGAYFWGDANGNGIIDADDITIIQDAYAGGAYTIQDVIPDSGYTQELTGNGLWADSGDITQLMNYFQGDFSAKPGQPDGVMLEGATHIILMEGESVAISAYALDNAADSDGKADKRAGWGIVFRVNTAPGTGRCTDVYIQGRDVLPQGTDGDSILWFPHPSRGNTAEAFAYTLDDNTIDHGLATVKVMAGTGCLPGDSIEVSVFIPSDAEAHISQNRNPSRIESWHTFRIVLYPAIPCTLPEECASGFCVDGYCCDTECTGECMACNLPGLEGTCSYIPYGDDPDLECMPDPAYPECAGACDGMGACNYEGTNGILCGCTCSLCIYEEYECVEGLCELYYNQICIPYACYGFCGGGCHMIP
jgi:hypothetical protein